ncbi:extracellular solute-binding protein, partial [Rhodococcus baikonurensis]
MRSIKRNADRARSTPKALADTGISRRAFLGTSAGAVGALLLSGCSAGGGSGSHSVNFTSWMFGNKSSGKALREVTTGFTRAHDIEVVDRTYPYAQYLNQLVLKARDGRSSGVVHIDEEWMSTLVTAGVLKEMSLIVDESLYPTRVLDSGTYQGKRYAMPWTQSAIGIVTNTELAREFGIDLENLRTIENFTEALRTIKRSDPTMIPYLPCTNVTQLKDYIPWVWAFGGSVVRGREVTLGDAGSTEALEYWKKLLDEGLIAPGIIRDDARTLFGQQRAVFYEDAPQAIGVVPKQSVDPNIADKMSSLPRPTGSHGTSANLRWSQPLVALTLDDDVQTLLQYMSTDDSALKTMFTASGQPPTSEEILSNPVDEIVSGDLRSGA